MRGERDTYKRAGTAGRDAFERAISMRSFLKPRDWRVLLACLSLTALYSRTSDTTSVGQLAQLCEVSLKRTSESLNRLADCGVISWSPTRTRGADGDSLLSLLDTQVDHARIMRRASDLPPPRPPSKNDEGYPF